METQQQTWQNMTGKIFQQSITQLVEEAIIREQANGHRLKVCVGSDSHVYGDAINYATAVVFIREGKGAFTFIRKEREIQREWTPREIVRGRDGPNIKCTSCVID